MTMFRPVTTALCAVLVAAAAALVGAAPASAATQCTFRPAPPKRVAVGKNVLRMRVGIRVHGLRGCTAEMIVSSYLVHRKDQYYLSWLSTKPNVQKVYAGAIVPGRYHTTRSTCSAYGGNSRRLSCTVARASTVIKYSGRTDFTATRDGSVVRFHVRARQFVAYQGFRPMRDHVAIQRRFGNGWRTIHSGVARARAGLSWSYRHAASATYRATSAGTGRTFAAVSGPVSK